MIPIEALRRVRRIIVHADCPDGIASAMILHDVMPDVEVIAVAYGPEREALEPGPADLFCDMTPPPAKVDAFVEAGAIVLDHHRGARELVERFCFLGVFADADKEPGVSGAVLAYREVWLQEGDGSAERRQRIWSFANLAGIRDCWLRQHEQWGEACAQAEVLMLWGLDEMLDESGPFLDRTDMVLGRRLYNDKVASARLIAGTGCLRISHSVAIFNDAPKPDCRISDVAEAMRELDPAVKLVVGFCYTVRFGEMQLVFSMRSSPGAEVTARQIAVANGGGGHDHAAGFTLRVVKSNEDEAFAPYVDRSPIEIFKSALASSRL